MSRTLAATAALVRPSLLALCAGAVSAPALARPDWSFQTATPWVQQVNAPNAWFGCGAASAKMILDTTIGQNTTIGSNQTLAQLRTDIEAHRVEGPGALNANGGFYTDPVAEQWAIGQYDTRFGGGPNHNRWIISRETDVKRAAGKLAQTFENYATPSATLVYKGGHWVTVTGVTTDRAPSLGNFAIKEFRINDPDEKSAKVGKNQVVSWETWKTSYQTPSKYGNANTNLGKMISVVDPDPVPDTVLEPVRPAPQAPISTPQEAMTAALGMLTNPSLSQGLSGLLPMFAEEVVVSQSNATAWWVGFGGGTLGQISGGILLDESRHDMLVAGWNREDSLSWGARTSYWPYLGDRTPTAGVGADTSDLFYVTAVPTPGSLILLGLGGLISVRRRRA